MQLKSYANFVLAQNHCHHLDFGWRTIEHSRGIALCFFQNGNNNRIGARMNECRENCEKPQFKKYHRTKWDFFFLYRTLSSFHLFQQFDRAHCFVFTSIEYVVRKYFHIRDQNNKRLYANNPATKINREVIRKSQRMKRKKGNKSSRIGWRSPLLFENCLFICCCFLFCFLWQNLCLAYCFETINRLSLTLVPHRL